MAFIRVEPVEVQVRTDWFSGRPREITWGDERLPITRLARRPRGGGRVSGHQRAADAVRGRHAASPAVADLHAPLAALDGHRPGRRGPSPRRLTLDQKNCGAPEHWGSRERRPRAAGPPLGRPSRGSRGGRAGTAPAPAPTTDLIERDDLEQGIEAGTHGGLGLGRAVSEQRRRPGYLGPHRRSGRSPRSNPPRRRRQVIRRSSTSSGSTWASPDTSGPPRSWSESRRRRRPRRRSSVRHTPMRGRCTGP